MVTLVSLMREADVFMQHRGIFLRTGNDFGEWRGSDAGVYRSCTLFRPGFDVPQTGLGATR